MKAFDKGVSSMKNNKKNNKSITPFKEKLIAPRIGKSYFNNNTSSKTLDRSINCFSRVCLVFKQELL